MFAHERYGLLIAFKVANIAACYRDVFRQMSCSQLCLNLLGQLGLKFRRQRTCVFRGGGALSYRA